MRRWLLNPDVASSLIEAIAQMTGSVLLEVAPDATVETIRRPHFKDEADLDRFLDGLRKAGLPE